MGYHSGSHFTTIQSLEPFLARNEIKPKFVGSVWARVDVGIDRDVAATSVWGLTYLVLEQFGFRKIVDTTFMIGFMFPPGVDQADVQKYMNGMQRAQMDLDLEPERYKHYYLEEIPDRYKSKVDVRRFSPGERIRVPALHRDHLRQDPGLAAGTRAVRGASAGRVRGFGGRVTPAGEP